MAVKAAELESDLMEKVCEQVRDRVPSERVGSCEKFVRQYYRWLPPQDLANRSEEDLYGAALAHWELAQYRAPGETKIRVYNPDPERDGWSTSHTVVEIVSDDMPFIVDSVIMALGRQGYRVDLGVHPVIRLRRDDDGRLAEVLDQEGEADDAIVESVLHAEVTREHDDDQLAQLAESIERVLAEVRAAVEDWGPMRERIHELARELEEHPPPVEVPEMEEVKAFLEWVTDDHFTFLGYREYELDAQDCLTALPESGLGIMRDKPVSQKRLRRKALPLARGPHVLVLTKANSRATVHRPAYLDYIGVKRFDSDGEVVGERRFLGLYTSAAYRASPRDIPLLRGKVDFVLERAGFPADSHDAKALLEILESYPRDALLQIGKDEVFDIAMGVLGVGERPRVRLFVWPDPLDRFLSCLVTVPRDRYNTENRERLGRILLEAFEGAHLDWSLQLSESVLARVHYIVRCPDGIPDEYDPAEIEAKLAKATRAFTDDLRDALVEQRGEEAGAKLHKRYERAFPPGYRSDWNARAAVEDIGRIEEVASSDGPIIDLYSPSEDGDGTVRCKLFSSSAVLLSDVLPTFEHMGAKVLDERPYEITPAGGDSVWLYDFGLRCAAEDVDRVKDIFQEAFLDTLRGELEDDQLNGLVLSAGLTGREVGVVRAIAKYLRQGGIAYSDAYMARTLLAHPDIARLIVKLFIARFDPEDPDPDLGERLIRAMEMAIDDIPSLDEDRILRAFLSVVRAILRTSYFREEQSGSSRPYVSLKLDPSELSVLPLPRPQFEIFVYSPRFEGVHLRGGKVARGGLRWSDRPEDFRSEILSLMKAQMVKNALIVPVGAKGGFVLKQPPAGRDREALQEEGVACYRMFLSGLLDVTDNIVDGKVVTPERVVCYDEEDPYLVVAADKGTAAFSDIANEVSEEFGFWLGDAFASGGSQGYDHKEMGITARGAWESVKRHFRHLGEDIQSTEFTVVGIGDMSGDVFGNGMLLSRHIKLLAAFDHRHVFLDPDPDPEQSFEERKRLFEAQRSAWSDYDEALISEGGGVFARSEKAITISPQVKEALAIDSNEPSPNELIQAILRAPVDLLWNGGIGTYVKASTEAHGDVGDKANDAVRVNGKDVRCRVIGEGGNLGLTQLGRIEYAREGGPEQSGGRLNTDSVDNVGGVNCSDHEVNIKILLDSLLEEGELSEDQRNELLFEMQDAVAREVLYGSYTQTQAISIALAQAAPMIDVHGRLIRHLEDVANIDREIEFLPNDDAIAERKSEQEGLFGPELAVLIAHCKILLHAQLLDSDVPEDDYLSHDLERYFPQPLPERYGAQMRKHRLRREIIATVVANQLVDRAGTTFAFRLGEETGAPPSLLARAYAASREIFEMRSFWCEVEALDNEVAVSAQLKMLIDGRRLLERATRWLVRRSPDEIDIAATVERFEPGAKLLAASLPDALQGEDREVFDRRATELREAGVPEDLVSRVAAMPSMLPALDIVEVAAATGRDPEAVMGLYFGLGARLELTWLRDRITELPRTNRWQALARGSLRDELYGLHRALTQEILEASDSESQSDAALEQWSKRQAPALERCVTILHEIRVSRNYDLTTMSVGLREIRNLIRGGKGQLTETARL